MSRAVSILILLGILAYPAKPSDVVGGLPLDPCTGKAGALFCIETNGAVCKDEGNVYESGGNSAKAMPQIVNCRDINQGNPNCSGTASRYSTNCDSTIGPPAEP